MVAVYCFFEMKLINRIMANEEAFHLVLAAFIGVIGGLVNLVFLFLVNSIQWIVFGQSDSPAVLAQGLSSFERIIIPTLGGLLAGLVLLLRIHLSGSKKVTNVLEAVAVGDGRLGMRATLIHAWSSLLSIGTGASIGREGAITQLTATFASKWGQFHRWQPYRLRLMVACGAAAGLAAAYNAPIAGALFAALVLVGNFSMNLFAPLVMASVVATMVSRFWFGIEPWYVLPESIDFGQAARFSQMGWFLILGTLSGVGVAFFLKSTQKVESATEKSAWPSWVKLGLAGLAVGLIALVFPGVWGNGYEITNQILKAESAETGFLVLDKVLFSKPSMPGRFRWLCWPDCWWPSSSPRLSRLALERSGGCLPRLYFLEQVLGRPLAKRLACSASRKRHRWLPLHWSAWAVSWRQPPARRCWR